MGYWQPADLKWSELQSLVIAYGDDWRIDSFLSQFAQNDIAGKRSRIDRTAELLPQVGDRSYMVFVGMGSDDAKQ